MNDEAVIRRVAVIVGSVSVPSLNRRLARGLEGLASDHGLSFVDVPIGDLPFFTSQMQSRDDYPEVGRAAKEVVDGAAGLLVVTPEYNRSIPGVLKNAIDWLSRPVGESSFPGRPAAVIGASRGAISTAVAQNHLKAILSSQGAAVLGDPEAYIRYQDGLISDDGQVTDASTREFLSHFLASFRTHIDRHV